MAIAVSGELMLFGVEVVSNRSKGGKKESVRSENPELELLENRAGTIDL